MVRRDKGSIAFRDVSTPNRIFEATENLSADPEIVCWRVCVRVYGEGVSVHSKPFKGLIKQNDLTVATAAPATTGVSTLIAVMVIWCVEFKCMSSQQSFHKKLESKQWRPLFRGYFRTTTTCWQIQAWHLKQKSDVMWATACISCGERFVSFISKHEYRNQFKL